MGVCVHARSPPSPIKPDCVGDCAKRPTCLKRAKGLMSTAWGEMSVCVCVCRADDG